MSNEQQENTQLSWSEVFETRNVIHRRYPAVWLIPVLRKRFELIRPLLIDGMMILDVGAGKAEWGSRLRKINKNITYKTVDIDPGQSPDYRSLQEIRQKFDLIICWEVIEHLTLEAGKDMIRGCENVLKPGGKLVISTPNIFNPSQFLMDSTHITPYSYEELGGLCLRAGFTVQEIYRTFHASILKFYLKTIFAASIHRIVGIDFTKSIIIIARKGP